MSDFDNQLGQMPLSGLEDLRRTVDRLICEKKDEQRRVVWCVEDAVSVLGIFRSDEYLLAAELLMREARENADQMTSIDKENKARFGVLMLTGEMVCQSDYDAMEFGE